MKIRPHLFRESDDSEIPFARGLGMTGEPAPLPSAAEILLIRQKFSITTPAALTLYWTVAGKSPEQVSDLLNIALSGIKNHLMLLYRRLSGNKRMDTPAEVHKTYVFHMAIVTSSASRIREQMAS
jgi:hypothetical protein